MNLQREYAIVRNGIDGPPETSIKDGDYALNRVSSGGLDSSKRVAQDDVRSAKAVRMPEDGVRVIGDDVGADVVLTSARGPRDHGMNGLVAEAVSDDEGENCLCGATARVIVEWRLIGNLRNGCDGITVCRPSDIGLVRCDTRGPLCVRLLVDSGPNLAIIEGATVNGSAGAAVDEYLISDFDQFGRTVVGGVVLGIELDAIDVVGRARGTRALDNAIGIGPGNGGESGDQVAIGNIALNRVVELGPLLIEEITNIFPGRSRRREACCRAVVRDDEVEDGFGYGQVGDFLGKRCRCREHESQLPILDGSFVDFQAIEVVATADALEIGEFLDQVESWRKAVVGRQDLHVGRLDRHGGLIGGIELQTRIKGRVELHVEKFGIVGLEHVRKNLDGVRFRPVEFLAGEGFD